MTPEDARKLVKCALEADNGCTHCAVQVVEEATKQWPEFDWREFLDSLTEDDVYSAETIKREVRVWSR